MRNPEKRKAWWRRYTQTARRKAWNRAYKKTEKYKAGRKSYRKSLKGRVATILTQRSLRTKRSSKDRKLRQKYGITLRQYEILLQRQANRCAICARPLLQPQVDHCHRQNHVRGVLCNQCNRALGLFGDSTVVLMSAIEYLNKAGK
jgi:hypothetical protein